MEIKADRDVLQALAESAGGGSSTIKELTAWLGEKVSRLKLRHDANNGLGYSKRLNSWRLEFTESHNCGVPWLRWRMRIRTRGVDFERLISRAEKQRAEVERRRLQLARFIFGPDKLQRSGRSRDVFPRVLREKSGSRNPLAVGATSFLSSSSWVLM